MSPLRIPARIEAIELPPFDPLNTRAAELRAEGHHVISLGQAVPFFPPPAPALDAARAALDTPAVNRYVTDQGLPALRDVLAARLGAACGSALSRDDLVITAGANHAFTLALMTMIAAGDEVVLPAPYFTNHQTAVCAFGATPVEAPIADRTTFGVKWSDIEPQLTSRTKLVVLCNPSNPTGAPVNARDGAAIVQESAQRGLLVISDETYMPFVYEGEHWSAASVERWRENVVVIGTFSKMFGMMGWRAGFMLADASVCAQAVKVQDGMIICAPVISQIAAEAAVTSAWDYPRSYHDEFRRRRGALAGALATIPGLDWTPPPAGMFAFVRIPGCDDSTRLALDLLERGHIVTIPGSVFGVSGEGHLRLSYGFAAAADLVEAIARLRQLVTSSA
jgi:aminotransferase